MAKIPPGQWGISVRATRGGVMIARSQHIINLQPLHLHFKRRLLLLNKTVQESTSWSWTAGGRPGAGS